ncbi:MAG: type II secretion system protein [Planctomycetes bacterium]|nr:type II secretion system protein [Planctomycetota bacterium]NOG55139.1 type II secretion system protein [Planctomycetota bacterium]
MQVGQEQSRALPDPADAGSEGTSGQRRAFSLIELVVCIGVLFILTGIMLPALHSAVRHGGKMKCANNLSQLGQALSQYAGENSDILPECGYFPFRSMKPHLPLAQILAPYLSGEPRSEVTTLWVCPNDIVVARAEKPDRSSYVYPPGRRTNRNVRLSMSHLQLSFPLLGDREPFHSPDYDPKASSGPYMPKVRRERTDWSDSFDFPDGHNRYRVDKGVSSASSSQPADADRN